MRLLGAIACCTLAGAAACASEADAPPKDSSPHPGSTDAPADGDPVNAWDPERTEALQHLLIDALDTHGWWDAEPADPGCAAAISDDGRRTVATWGSADLTTGQPIEADTVFDVASVSKMFTAGVVASLVTDGTITFDDPVARWFPELGHLDSSLTVADLVHHTSGLDDYIDLLMDDGYDLEDPTTMSMALESIFGIEELLFAPGSTFDYSNSNYVLLAEMVERAGGEPFPRAVATRLTEPLGLKVTAVPTERPVPLDDLARGHEDQGGWQAAESRWTQVGDGAVHTSVGDLLGWAEALMDPAVTRQAGLDDDWSRLMLTPGPMGDDDGSAGYGGGLVLAGDRIGHEGSWLGYSAALWWWPTDRLAVAVACNVEDLGATAIADDLIDRWE